MTDHEATTRPAAGGGMPTRRGVLQGGAAILGAAVLNLPFIRPSYAARSLKVATFGGNFENSFIKSVYPAFEKASGIAVESVSQPGNLQFLVQLSEANKSGIAPLDLCTSSQENVFRGAAAKVWRSFDTSRIPNIGKLNPRFVHQTDGAVDAIGAMAWYQTLIVNPKIFKQPPESWKVLWDPAHRNAWGLTSGGGSDLFEITAATWFGGNAILDTEEGILKVLAKIAELKPNVKLWWESEGTMQTAYENDEVIGGMYYHDVAGVMAKGGVPVTSVFPKEGGVIDFGCWCQPSASTKVEEAQEFVNFMCTPEAQALMTRSVGTAPLVDRAATDLTDAEFAAVSSEVPPIDTAVDQRIKHLDFMDAQFTKMLAA